MASLQAQRAQFHSSRLLQGEFLLNSHVTRTFLFSNAAETVKVPQMAESISEGTLKGFAKQVGDFVEADEEVATIETDKVRLSELIGHCHSVMRLIHENEL